MWQISSQYYTYYHLWIHIIIYLYKFSFIYLLSLINRILFSFVFESNHFFIRNIDTIIYKNNSKKSRKLYNRIYSGEYFTRGLYIWYTSILLPLCKLFQYIYNTKHVFHVHTIEYKIMYDSKIHNIYSRVE